MVSSDKATNLSIEAITGCVPMNLGKHIEAMAVKEQRYDPG